MSDLFAGLNVPDFDIELPEGSEKLKEALGSLGQFLNELLTQGKKSSFNHVIADDNDRTPGPLDDKVENSIVVDTTNHKLQLSGDAASPGNSKYYGTDSGGTKGFHSNSDTVKLTGDQEVGGVKTFTSIPVLPASDPTTDNQASRKAYVDGKFNTSTGHDHDGTDSKKLDSTGMSGILGAWVNVSVAADRDNELAATDGLLVGYGTTTGGNSGVVDGYTDGNSPPTTYRYRNQSTVLCGISMPVKKGDRWKVGFAGTTMVAVLFWIPSGS